MAKKFTLELVKSTRGCSDTQIRTLNALGLKRRTDKNELTDSPQTRGQIRKIQHLILLTVKGA